MSRRHRYTIFTGQSFLAGLAFLVLTSFLWVLPAWGAGCDPVLTRTAYHRYQPHSFYDQGVATLAASYPRHVLLAGRRDAPLGDLRYALLVYREEPRARRVHIEGLAVRSARAWTFSAVCAPDQAVAGMVRVFDELGRRAFSPAGPGKTSFPPAAK